MATEASTLPYDVDIEQAVLGSLIVTPELIEHLRPLLEPSSLYDPLHQRIYSAMLAISADGAGVTPLTINAGLGADPGLKEVGGLSYLAGLAGGAPALPNLQSYARILIDLAVRRAIIRGAEDMIDRASSGALHTPVVQQLHGAEQEIEGARRLWERASGAQAVRSASEVGSESLARAEHHLQHGTEKRRLVPTGLAKVNEHIGGFAGGDLVLVAGRPGQGKSSVLGLHARAAAGSGFPCIVFSKEMVANQWVERTQCDIDFSLRGRADRPIYYGKFRKGTLSNLEIERLAEANRELAAMPLEICDTDELTMADIVGRSRAFRAKHDGKLGLIVVDYLQIIDAPTDGPRGRSREQEVATLARGLKSLAKRLQWPVVAGAQINRQTERRDEADRRPTLADLRESGALEQEADIVLAPYRKAYYIHRRKPEDPAKLPEWHAELREWEPRFEYLGLKFRHGSDFTVDDLYCDMGASAIRDEKPNDFNIQPDLSGLTT